MVTGKVDTLTARGTIPGVGAARLGKYGSAFLAGMVTGDNGRIDARGF